MGLRARFSLAYLYPAFSARAVASAACVDMNARPHGRLEDRFIFFKGEGFLYRQEFDPVMAHR
jgi:hypothetical protein